MYIDIQMNLCAPSVILFQDPMKKRGEFGGN